MVLKKNKMEFNLVLESDFKKLNEKVDRLLTFLLGSNNSSFNEKIYTNKELCLKLNVCTKTLHHYRKSGMIKFNQVGRKIYYPENAVQEFLNNHSVNKKRRVYE
jgi:mevalonate kinase